MPIAEIPAKLCELLATQSPEDCKRVVQATLILFGDEVTADIGSDSTKQIADQSVDKSEGSDPASYFNDKHQRRP